MRRKTGAALLASIFTSLCALSNIGYAASVGNVRKIESVGTQAQLHIQTDRGHLIQISILRDDMFRVWAGADGKLIGAGDKAAPIVLITDFAKPEVSISEQRDYQLIQTKAMALRVYRKPFRLALYKADNRTQLWQELQPLDIGEKNSFQTLSSSADEAFFGGGQQNGNYAFKGKTLEVSYSGGWEEK